MTLTPASSRDGSRLGQAGLSPTADAGLSAAQGAGLTPPSSRSSSGLDAYIAAVLDSSPRAFYKLDDLSGLPVDSSGNGLDMTSKTIAAGHYRQAGPFDGWFATYFGGDESCSRAAISAQNDNVTIESWFNLQILQADTQGMIGQQSGGAGYALYMTAATKPVVLLQGVGFEALWPTAVAIGDWHLLVATRRAGVWKYAMDGVIVSANAGSDAPNTPWTTTAIHGASAMAALYSMTAFYDRSLPDDEILAHFEAAA